MKQYYHSVPRMDDTGALLHTGLRSGQVAPCVLLPGDPHRSELISGFFDESHFVGRRGTYATYTGATEGVPISVMSSGMGCACVPVALEELKQAGAQTVIRVGTCGGVQPNFRPGAIVIASGCVRGEGASYEYVPEEFPAFADPTVVDALIRAARELGEEPVVGLYRSHDSFYMESKAAHPGLRERMQRWIDTNVQVVENESGTLFTFGHLLGLRTATICVALGSMFDEMDEKGDAIYAVYQDPNFMARRIETVSRIAMRAAVLLTKEG